VASIDRYTPGNPVVIKGLEGASQTSTFLAGDPVKFSAGYVVVATEGDMNGIARRNPTGTQSSTIEVELIDPNAVYSVRLSTGTTHAQALVGTNVDFQFTTPGAMCMEDGTTDAYVVGLDERDAVGTSGGRLLIRFHYGTLEAAD